MTAVVGAKDRRTARVRAKVVRSTDAAGLQEFVRSNVEQGASLYTDEATAYEGTPDYDHEAVKHSVGEYVRGQATTNGVESFWSMLKRAHKGTFHKISSMHLERYVERVSREAQPPRVRNAGPDARTTSPRWSATGFSTGTSSLTTGYQSLAR